MKAKKLYYSEKDSVNPREFDLKDFDYLFIEDFLASLKQLDDRKTVYLLSYDLIYNEYSGTEPIYVDSDNYFIIDLLEGLFNKENIDIHLQEYESYEDAYKVALSMRELNPLCYSDASE